MKKLKNRYIFHRRDFSSQEEHRYSAAETPAFLLLGFIYIYIYTKLNKMWKIFHKRKIKAEGPFFDLV